MLAIAWLTEQTAEILITKEDGDGKPGTRTPDRSERGDL